MSSTTPFVTHAVRAGAGAGKTYHLTHKVMEVAEEFFQKNNRWPTLQVTTFTRKATQELNERLLHLAMEKKAQLLDFVTSKNLLKISTIDAILDGFLKKHGAAVGLSADFSYISAGDADLLSKKTLKTILETKEIHREILSYFEFHEILNFMRDGADLDLSRFKIITKDALVDYLVEKLAEEKKAVQDFVGRVQEANFSDAWVEVEQVLSRVALLLRKEEWKPKTLADILDNFDTSKGLKSKKQPGSTEIGVELTALKKDLKKLLEPRFDPEQFDFHIKLNTQFYNLLAEYQNLFLQAKKDLNKIQIRDLTSLSLQVIRNYPEVAQVYSKDIDYWLIDEFQDTSPLQIEILDALMDSKPFYFVGDPQQSIYLFRGARSSVFLERIEWAKTNKGKIEFLDKNWRSEPALLGFINDVSKELGENFSPMQPAKDPTKDKEPSALFTVVSGVEEKEEASKLELDSLAQHIRNLWTKGVDLKNVVVLVRKNDQLQEVSEILTQWKVPHLIHSPGSYWLRREVQDAIALLKAIVNPYDDNSVMTLLRSPYLAISEQKLIDMMEARKASVWQAFDSLASTGELSEISKRFCSLLKLKKDIGVTACFQKCLLDLGFFDTHLISDEGGRVEGNLWKFVHLLKDFEKNRGANFTKFINDCQRAADLEKTKELPSSVESQRVNLMTVHASKGLQFEYVFLPFLHQEAFQKKSMQFIIDDETQTFAIRTPSSTDLQSYGSLLESRVLNHTHVKEDEESLRVFYVAFTRAKKALYLSWNQDLKDRSPARFLTAFATEAGEHQKEGYSIKVHHIQKSEDVTVADIEPVVTKLRTPYNKEWTRVANVEEPVEQNKDVPSFFEANSYKNSFINKRRGILFHRIMESLKYPASVNMVELIQAWFPGEEEEMAEALNYIIGLKKPPLIDIIKNGEAEWSFAMENKDKTKPPVEGQIDLWGMVNNELWIVDYKSGSKVRKAQSFEQLTTYAEALRGHLNWKNKINLAVVYPFLKETHAQKVPGINLSGGES